MTEIYKEIANLAAKNEPGVLVTIVATEGSVPRKAGAKMLVKADGASVGTVGGGSVEYAITQKALEVMRSGKPQLLHFDLAGNELEAAAICGGRLDVFFEPILAQDTLYLFGAGHISRTTAAMGKMLGFRVVVIDPRAEFNNRERFPDADSLMVEEFGNVFPKLSIDEKDYIIIYTSAHELDEDCLNFALTQRAGYVGMIGSRKKVKEIREHLTQKGVTQEALDRVHAPIGLDIGAETPEEIALSILAEVTKVRRSRKG
ncbi:MAG: XdhC/CoxI family protein [Chloroflexota bacterium]